MNRALVNKKRIIVEHLEESIQLKKHLQSQTKTLITIADVLVKAFREGNKVLLLGNGGSAADAQHMACELMGRFYKDRSPLPAIALTTNTSSLTAIANDYGYETVFAKQVRALIRNGDVVIGISTSGASRNVILAMEEAKKSGGITVAFTGHGGRLAKVADYILSLPSSNTPRVQEAHITAGHIIAYLVEETLFGNGAKV